MARGHEGLDRTCVIESHCTQSFTYLSKWEIDLALHCFLLQTRKGQFNEPEVQEDLVTSLSQFNVVEINSLPFPCIGNEVLVLENGLLLFK